MVSPAQNWANCCLATKLENTFSDHLKFEPRRQRAAADWPTPVRSGGITLALLAHLARAPGVPPGFRLLRLPWATPFGVVLFLFGEPQGNHSTCFVVLVESQGNHPFKGPINKNHSPQATRQHGATPAVIPNLDRKVGHKFGVRQVSQGSSVTSSKVPWSKGKLPCCLGWFP